jgi:ABC-2 type transport system permease protein
VSSTWPSRALVADTVRGHRWGIVAWILGCAVAMTTVAAGFASETARFAGGARAMAASMRAGVEAMRPLRWPADRLDTLGGYLTYHNVGLFALALSLYAATQGAHAIRGAEARGVPAEILATGRSRLSLLVDRAAGFALTLALICLGLGGALAVSMAVGDAPDVGGSFITALAVGLCALVAYALGVLVSQVTPTERAGTAVTGLLLAVLYLLTNVAGDIGPVGAVRYVSPFHYYNLSRALVPGHGLDAPSIVGMAAATVVLLGAAGWALRSRDYDSGLLARRARPARPVRRIQRPALRSVWAATLLRQRGALLAWAAAAAAYLGLTAWLEPTVADMWEKFQMTRSIIGGRPGSTPADQYLAFVGQLVAPIVIAYVVVQAAGWVSDLRQGRVEMVLAAPMSWPRLVFERLLATTLGAAVIIAVAMAGLTVTAAAAGVRVDALGVARLAAVTLLLSAALAAVAAIVVAWLRTAAAVTALAVFVAASYLLVYLVPLFAWPDWVARASVFGAVGTPYLELPAWTGLAVLTGLAGLGGVCAALIAQRSAKVAT